MASDQQQGILLIPDISGFTEFVSEVEISHSEHIITELLGLLIQANSLKLHLCEIEGDALFFYRGGWFPTLDEVIEQVRVWFLKFHEHLNLLKRDSHCRCGACQDVGNLGLKVVGHAGEFVVYNLEKKQKVIGKDVILVHRLLKNSLSMPEYLLLSSAALEQMGRENRTGWKFQPQNETYPVLGEVSTGYVNLAPLRAEVPPTPPRDEIPHLSGSISEQIEIAAPLERVVAHISDLDTWPEWVEGLEEMKFDRSAPVKPGHHHVCVFPGQELSITVDRINETESEFTLVTRIKPPPVLKQWFSIFRAEKTPTGVTVTDTYTFSRVPILGRIFDLKAVPMLLEQMRASLQNLKLLVETEQEKSGPPK